MPTITTADATKLYVKDWGSGQPVILMSGWPLSSDSWDDQAMAIARPPRSERHQAVEIN